MGPGKTAEFVAGCNAGCNGLVIARALVPDSDPSPVVWREPRTRAARAPTPTSQGQPSPELPAAVWRASAALRAQPGATYITARGLPGPWPVSVRWLSTESARRVVRCSPGARLRYSRYDVAPGDRPRDAVCGSCPVSSWHRATNGRKPRRHTSGGPRRFCPLCLPGISHQPGNHPPTGP